eukprot:SAG31_NODE_20232_length_580_cov_1.259875_1_plen_123_part_10
MLLAGLRSQPAAAVLPAGAVAVVVAGLASVLLHREQNRMPSSVSQPASGSLTETLNELPLLGVPAPGLQLHRDLGYLERSQLTQIESFIDVCHCSFPQLIQFFVDLAVTRLALAYQSPLQPL